jgi:hypothetical protein
MTSIFRPREDAEYISLDSGIFRLCAYACSIHRPRLVPDQHSLESDGPVKIGRRHAKRVGLTLFHLARNLDRAGNNEAHEVRRFAAALAMSNGGILYAL